MPGLPLITPPDLRPALAVCYKRRMRELRDWISEKMRRRPRRGPNDSESTGKSGQELPANQPAPLRPSYPERVPVAASQPAVEHEAPATSVVQSTPVPAPEAPEQKVVVETQPESL